MLAGPYDPKAGNDSINQTRRTRQKAKPYTDLEIELTQFKSNCCLLFFIVGDADHVGMLHLTLQLGKLLVDGISGGFLANNFSGRTIIHREQSTQSPMLLVLLDLQAGHQLTKPKC